LGKAVHVPTIEHPNPKYQKLKGQKKLLFEKKLKNLNIHWLANDWC